MIKMGCALPVVPSDKMIIIHPNLGYPVFRQTQIV